jgi:hypothetical protein
MTRARINPHHIIFILLEELLAKTARITPEVSQIILIERESIRE